VEIAQAPRGGNVAAIFDFDGVLVRGNSSFSFASALARRHNGALRSAAHTLLAAGLFLFGSRAFYATYGALGRLLADCAVEEVLLVAEGVAGQLWANSTHIIMQDLVAAHIDRGHTVVIASGAPLLLVEPFGKKFGTSLVIASEYAVSSGRFTGKLAAPPPCGPEKLRRLKELSVRESFDLSQCFAYCNDYSDRTLLGAVAHPIAVNPDRLLTRLAMNPGTWLR
jgi:HAD superfamily hydrolase (TIGR01490 family)